MRVPTLIVHIGTAKTGSTAVQTALHRHRDDLRRCGIGYAHGDGFVNARDLAAACVGAEGDDDLLDELGVRAAADVDAYRRRVVGRLHRDLEILAAGRPELDTVVISSEHFHSRLVTPAMVERLAEVLEPIAERIRVVCYLRRQVDLLTSFWSTYLRNGGTESLDEVGDRVLRVGHPYADYETLLSMWGDVFGSDAVEPRIFGEFRGGTVLGDLAAVIGAPDGLLSEQPPENPSIDRLGQVLLLAVNRAVRDGADPDALRGVRSTLVTRFTGPGERWSPAEAARRQSAFDAGNETVRQRWFPGRPVLFSSSFEPSPPIVVADDRIAALTEVFAGLARTPPPEPAIESSAGRRRRR